MDNITKPEGGSVSSLSEIFDFKDFFSPMLVKEVRQGLRSISFTIIFLVAQLLLCVGILMTLLVNQSGAATALSGFIFFILILVVCGAQPFRAANAINGEIKGDTLDLLSLTSLSSWKIVQGKWVSLMAQSLLFAISLLPFLILRYFLGQMELFTELALFGLIVILGGVITAIVVGLSALPNAFARFAAVGVVVMGSLITILIYMMIMFSEQYIAEFAGVIISQPYVILPIVGVVFALIYVGYMALDFAASFIAPVSENRAFWRRVIFLGLLVAGIIAQAVIYSVYISGPWKGEIGFIFAQCFILFMCLALFFPHVVAASTENPFVAKNVAKSLKAKKYIGFVRYALYPGWGSGIIFIALASLLFCVQLVLTCLLAATFDTASTSSYVNYNVEEVAGVMLTFLTVLGVFLLPAAFVALFFKYSNFRLVFYVVGLIVIGLLTIIILIINEVSTSGYGYNTASFEIASLFLWIPSINLVQAMDYNNSTWEDFSFHIFFGWFTVLASIAIILVRSIPEIKHIQAQERASKDLDKLPVQSLEEA